MKKLKEILKETSLPAIPRIIHNDHIILKLIWLLCLIGLTLVAAYYISLNILNYLSYSVVTNLAIYNEEQIEFPMIGICFDYGSLNLTNKSVESFLISCSFDSIYCNYQDFEYYTDYISNECFLFNSGKNYYNKTTSIRYITRADINYGLKIWFWINDYRFSLGPYKMSVYIQNHSSVFNRLQAYQVNNGLLIPPGLTAIQIEREFIQNLPEPYNQCITEESDPILNLFNNFTQNKIYSQKDCLEICVGFYIMNECNCSNFNLIEACFLKEIHKECVINLFNGFQSKLLKLPDDCLTNCPLECNFINYNFIQNSFSLTDQYLKSIDSPLNISNKENLVILSINFKSKQYTLIDQIPKMEIFDLINSFGSLLSLFIGFSFMSLVEIIDIFMRMFFHLLIRRKNKVIQIK
jgi:hypothetical protein